ncbi:MAG TPA: hypothetical protein GXX39_09955 [Syntrophothermus lipocalidus]|uniref:DNA polymerase beta domain protein region n=1 Tax=Syntrophothermus lipocalidus (strain DSM 12680 / TGB-C1) TaxID=643648 RepID=D7CJD0_SYNLT|nr:hypothetical protein [Syntrophothermus lipocalidus]ADI01019.1 hypothetical protein Slip_0231 [Syntrophothermus lipocalidus DSM 12680]HHV77669.1 hypothetical protein [Syntrophothermus lipocalidus]HOV42998.1 hypothetical protein [Syntrophothermus lipocalidus]
MGPKKNKVDVAVFKALHPELVKLDERKKEERLRLAWQKAGDIAAMLRHKCGAREVYLYGCSAWGGFDEHSDIDLLAVGRFRQLRAGLQ